MIEEYDGFEFEVRKPVLNQETAVHFLPQKMDRQWRVLTEIIRREILINSKVREALVECVTAPLSELLPLQCIKKIQSIDELVFDRLSRFIQKHNDQLWAYLQLPPVPDEQLTPDIKSASMLPSPDRIIHQLRVIYTGREAEFQQSVFQRIEDGEFLHGVTSEEKKMVAQRYRFARDIKLLALLAETYDFTYSSNEQEKPEAQEDRSLTLPSGVKVYFNNGVNTKNLVDALDWRKRRQIKDRVYEVTSTRFKYILKERKTARHVDTKKLGHRPGLSSLEEFEVAKYFHEHACIAQDNIRLTWEKPIVAVEFPDGFQFVMFEYEYNLIEADRIYQELFEVVKTHQEIFEPEFTKVCGQVRETYKIDISMLSFAEFAAIKALVMVKKARDLMKNTITIAGYTNRDLDGYAYRIDFRDHALSLEIVGFDFEYFSRINQNEVESVRKRREENRRSFTTLDLEIDKISLLLNTFNHSAKPVYLATYLTMLDSVNQ